MVGFASLYPDVEVLLHVETMLLGKLKPSTVKLGKRVGYYYLKVVNDKKT